MKKSILLPFIGCSALLVLVLFTNATIIDYEGIKQGTVSTPLTLIQCSSLKDFNTSCLLNLSGHRGRDTRLLNLQKNGLVSSRLFEGNIVYVNSANEFNANSGRLRGGDQLVLRNSGNWTNAILRFSGNGSASAPILIRAESNVRLSGISSISISGSHIFIKDIKFKNAIVTTSNKHAFRIGSSSAPCNYCVLTNSEVDSFNWPINRMGIDNFNFVSVDGKDITIANSVFKNHNGRGRMIQAAAVPVGAPLRLHVLRNSFINRPKVITPDGETNGFEVLYIGGSSLGATPSYSLIENNFITKADGEIEIMTIKASDMIIRNNTFKDNQGALTLRHSERTLVEGNFFVGSDRANLGGLRVMGQGHVIVNNHFENLKGTSESLYPISIRMADQERVLNHTAGYSRVKNVLIANNTIANCAKGIILSAGFEKKLPGKYSLLPQNVSIVNNIFFNLDDSVMIRSPLVTAWGGYNLTNNMIRVAGTSGVPVAQRNIEIVDLSSMARASGDIIRIKSTSAGVKKAYVIKSISRGTDINGLALKGSPYNIGNDDYGSDANADKQRRPFRTETDVILSFNSTQVDPPVEDDDDETVIITPPISPTTGGSRGGGRFGGGGRPGNPRFVEE